MTVTSIIKLVTVVSWVICFLTIEYFIKKISKELTHNYKGMKRIGFKNHTI